MQTPEAETSPPAEVPDPGEDLVLLPEPKPGERAWVKHPDLDTAREVAATALLQLEASGWVELDPEEVAAELTARREATAGRVAALAARPTPAAARPVRVRRSRWARPAPQTPAPEPVPARKRRHRNTDTEQES